MVNFAIYDLQSRCDFSLPRYQLCASISAYFLSAEERVYSCRCWESLAECRIAFLQRGTSESQAHTHNPPRKHKYQPQLGTTRWCQFQTALSLENPWWLKALKTSNKQKNISKMHVKVIYVKCKMHLSPGRRLSRSPNCAASPWIPGSLTVPRPDWSWMPCFLVCVCVCICVKT